MAMTNGSQNKNHPMLYLCGKGVNGQSNGGQNQNHPMLYLWGKGQYKIIYITKIEKLTASSRGRLRSMGVSVLHSLIIPSKDS